MIKANYSGRFSISSILISGFLVLPECALARQIKPIIPVIKIPKKGIKSISDETTKCVVGKNDSDVEVGVSNKTQILVKDCMSDGSGHWHTVFIGFGNSSTKRPARGVKLSTSTAGWITIGGFNGGGLPWLKDVNGDGNSELIIWQSFPDSVYNTASSNGLIPFVYSLKGDVFSVDAKSTCAMMDQTLVNYQKEIHRQKTKLRITRLELEVYLRITARIVETRDSLCSMD